MSDCTCTYPYPNVVEVCGSCVLAQIERFHEKFPGIKDFQPDPNLDGCCQRDQVADEFGWEAAWEWDTLRWLVD